jgi:formamidopyrimidine-DNA glycosylase
MRSRRSLLRCGSAVPELPEVRAHAARLATRYLTRHLTRFDALSFTALKTAVPDPSIAVGRPLTRLDTRGKYLRIGFDTLTFVIHLMQGGRLEPDERQVTRPRGGLARWRFDPEAPLLLTETGTERRAGVWVVEGDSETQAPLDGLGPEADDVDVDRLGALLRASTGRLHTVLRDQRQVAGLGRRLANEICHRAQLSPFANAARLTDDAVGALWQAIHDTIEDSMTYEAAQHHMTRSADRPTLVHHRTGEPCTTCGDTIREVRYATYTVNYCPTCQTGGKVLVDNTTSKFLK